MVEKKKDNSKKREYKIDKSAKKHVKSILKRDKEVLKKLASM